LSRGRSGDDQPCGLARADSPSGNLWQTDRGNTVENRQRRETETESKGVGRSLSLSLSFSPVSVYFLLSVSIFFCVFFPRPVSGLVSRFPCASARSHWAWPMPRRLRYSSGENGTPGRVGSTSSTRVKAASQNSNNDKSWVLTSLSGTSINAARVAASVSAR